MHLYWACHRILANIFCVSKKHLTEKYTQYLPQKINKQNQIAALAQKINNLTVYFKTLFCTTFSQKPDPKQHPSDFSH